MMFRLTITSSLIFLTNFRYYLYFVMPFTCLPMLVTAKMTTDANNNVEVGANGSGGGCEV